jgi:hypothetical protein
MTLPPTMISDAVLAVENSENIATAIPPSSQTPLLTSLQTPLDSLCRDPFRPTAWRNLTSVMRRPRRWLLASSTVSSKTTKIPLRFRQHTTTGRSSPTSSLRDLASHQPSLPKGWVYTVEDVSVKTEVEVVNPNNYLMLSTPLTRHQHKRLLDDQLADQHHQHQRASNIIEAPLSSLSTSRRTATKCRRVTSALTSMPQTPL